MTDAVAEVRRPLVTIRGLTKRFGDVVANDAVDLDIVPGEVLALLGENGAGKSTLMRVLYGLHRPDAGRILLDGAPIAFGAPNEAMAAGLAMVFQQFSLVPALSVLENLLVAWPRAPWWQARSRPGVQRALAQLNRYVPGIDPARRVGDLSVGERQSVELAKALNLEPRLLILDEPTSVLTPPEAARLHALTRAMAAEGRAVVFITHKIADVTACADRIAVMRRGRLVAEGPAAGRSPAAIVAAMVGTAPAVTQASPPPLRPEPRLQIVSLTTVVGAHCPVRDLSLTVGAGEVVGIAGVQGNGQVALAEAIAGLEPVQSGAIVLDGVALVDRPARTHAAGLAYIPERPLDNAVAADLDLALNLGLRELRSQPLFGGGARRNARAAALLRDYDVRPPEPRRLAGALSGGNLQRLVIARELSGQARLVLACYPTMGLDVRATAAVRKTLMDHARAGAAVLWMSEDLDELIAYAHRIGVLHEGRLVGVLPTAQAERERLGRMMTGLEDALHVA